MKTIAKMSMVGLLGLGVAFTAIACGDDGTDTSTTAANTTTVAAGGNGSGGDGGTTAAGGQGGGMPEAFPVLGTQIDRFGRPAINTATNNTFVSLDQGMLQVGTDENRAAAEDEWNANDDPSTWGQYVPRIVANLAILDSLDANCGNQAGYTALGNPPYATLATVLANDWLIVKGDATTCTTYLGVEADVLGVTNADCGGRKPSYDILDATYSYVAGAFDPGTFAPGFGDNVAASPGASADSAFPFLAPPN